MLQKTEGNGYMTLNNATAIYYPKSMQEALFILRNTPRAKIISGGTSLSYGTITSRIELDQTLISVSGIDELKVINKTERYIEIGACVTLNEILELGHNIPCAISSAISRIGNYGIRNIATIGGNIVFPNRYLSLFAVLLAFDAKIEIRTLNESIMKPLYQFVIDNKETAITTPKKNKTDQKRISVLTPSLISKIRIPIIQETISFFEKFYTPAESNYPENFVMIVSLQSGLISDIRIAYAGTTFFRFRELENRLASHAIPLTLREIETMTAEAESFLDEIEDPIPKIQLLHIIRKCLENIR